MNLKKLRKKLNMTQKEFASVIGYNVTYYGHLETGKEPLTKRAKIIIRDAVIEYQKAFKE